MFWLRQICIIFWIFSQLISIAESHEKEGIISVDLPIVEEEKNGPSVEETGDDKIYYPPDEKTENRGLFSLLFSKEHGTLDSPGRDFIKKIVKNINNVEEKIEKKIGLKPSNISAGLDSDKNFFSGVADKFKEKLQAIYPGTKWCGDGTKAKNYDELGKYSETDKCCREHDFCPENIAADEVKYGLVNTGLFTRSHCDCDKKFYDCLKEASTSVSKKIGFTYFTVLGPQCYKKDYKIIGCGKMALGKCVEYEYESTGEKCYQWFDSPVF